jgi:hypothetical protein
MKWHNYPEEAPENGQVCLIKPENAYYYADHTIVTFLLDRWKDYSHGEEYDLFEYPLWLSLDEIEEVAQ